MHSQHEIRLVQVFQLAARQLRKSIVPSRLHAARPGRGQAEKPFAPVDENLAVMLAAQPLFTTAFETARNLRGSLRGQPTHGLVVERNASDAQDLNLGRERNFQQGPCYRRAMDPSSVSPGSLSPPHSGRFPIMVFVKAALLLFVLFFLLPLGISALLYQTKGSGAGWQTADRSSAGLLPATAQSQDAVVRIFAAQTVRWRGIFATHCWIVFKPAGAVTYTRYDYTAWGEPLRMNGFEPDGRWFGHVPQVVFAADGIEAASLVPKIQAAITRYAYRRQGDYRAWPGPNSNTFIAAIIDAVPEIQVALPPTAIGKDYPYDGKWLRPASSGIGIRLTLGGYGGLAIGWVEGIEINILGAIAGIDLRHPAIKLPGLGRLGWRPSEDPA
jgi:hypothetical protein